MLSVEFGKIQSLSNKVYNKEGWLKECNSEWFLQEKIDGSNFWFYIDTYKNKKEMVFGCKNKLINVNDSTFKKTIITISLLIDEFNTDYIYFGESVPKNKSVTIEYDKIPPYYFILFDIRNKITNENYNYTFVQNEASRLGLMIPQIIHDNQIHNEDIKIKIDQTIKDMEDGTIRSCLGGNAEGVVLKNPNFISKMGELIYKRNKYVTKAFKESHNNKNVNMKKEDGYKVYLYEYGTKYSMIPRFVKAVQRMKEQGNFDPIKQKNYSKLSLELDNDLIDDEKDEIMDTIWDFFKLDIMKAFDEKTEYVHRIYLNINSNMELEIERIKEMLWIEYIEHVLKGSRQKLFTWFNETTI
jgi:hypothetical protein